MRPGYLDSGDGAGLLAFLIFYEPVLVRQRESFEPVEVSLGADLHSSVGGNNGDGASSRLLEELAAVEKVGGHVGGFRLRPDESRRISMVTPGIGLLSLCTSKKSTPSSPKALSMRGRIFRARFLSRRLSPCFLASISSRTGMVRISLTVGEPVISVHGISSYGRYCRNTLASRARRSPKRSPSVCHRWRVSMASWSRAS